MKRRNFLKNVTATAVGTAVFPTIVPVSVFGKNAPSNKINIGQIGVGRIARSHDIPETIPYEQVQFVAVCDVDKKRLLDGKKMIDGYYNKKTGKSNYSDVKCMTLPGDDLDEDIDAYRILPIIGMLSRLPERLWPKKTSICKNPPPSRWQKVAS